MRAVRTQHKRVALRVDSGGKIPCFIGELDPYHQHTRPDAQPSELHSRFGGGGEDRDK